MDSWFWKHEKLGQYTVKSDYASIRDAKEQESLVETSWWKKMWNLKMPLKVKHIIWRVARNVMPTKDQLILKRVPVIERCPMCDIENETVSWIASTLQQYNAKKAQEWKNAQDRSYDISLGFMTNKDAKENWEHPWEGTVKVNVDDSIFENPESYCVSMIAHNFRGDVGELMASSRSGRIDPEMPEAIGVKEALIWAKEKSKQPVMVETDCLYVLQAIRCSSVNLSYLGRLIEECKTLVSELKQRNITLMFVK
ncbi:uncharacterized protein LOC141687007 [Apium graveolens]|uniref:uncharacterized protein LOC141687007 n=1 Tax=Apium graveolens TaxID=4045 RepID=UPI003D7A63F7